MRPDVQRDFDWQSQFIPFITPILGYHLFTEATFEQDTQQATDLVLVADRIQVACRIRRHSFFKNPEYRDQFTLRTSRPTGAQTELAKVLSGWGTHNFYGFADETETGLVAWMLGDLNVFRLWHNNWLAKNNGNKPGIEKINGDGSSGFRAYWIDHLPPAFVVGRNAPTFQLTMPMA